MARSWWRVLAEGGISHAQGQLGAPDGDFDYFHLSPAQLGFVGNRSGLSETFSPPFK